MRLPVALSPARLIGDARIALALLRGKSDGRYASDASGVQGQALPPLPMRLNASVLLLDFFIGSALGFPFWIVTARLLDPAEVGIGSAALSGIQLCLLLAMLGIGSAIVLLLPDREHEPSQVLSTAYMLALTSGSVVALGFLVVMGVLVGGELSQLTAVPLYTAAFLLLNGVFLLTRTLDSTFMALRRTDRVLARSAVQGVIALGALVALSFATGRDGLLSILGAWICALGVSVVLGFIFLRRALPGVQLRVSASRSKLREVTSIGLPNFGLRLAMAVPVNVIPIVVVEVLDPSAGAYWYAVWMIAMNAMMVPGTTSNALFAEAANRPDQMNASARRAIRFSLTLGLPVAASIALVAPWALQILGDGYSAAGTTALRIVVLGVVPNTMINAYIARQRITRQLREPTIFSILASALSIAGAIIGGSQFGLNGIAIAWLSAQCFSALWATWKLRDLYTEPRRARAEPHVQDLGSRIEPVSATSRGVQQ